MHLTAFIIPLGHTVYIAPRVVHSNDHMKGLWRTMLGSPENEEPTPEDKIDHVLLMKKSEGEEKPVDLFFGHLQGGFPSVLGHTGPPSESGPRELKESQALPALDEHAKKHTRRGMRSWRCEISGEAEELLGRLQKKEEAEAVGYQRRSSSHL